MLRSIFLFSLLPLLLTSCAPYAAIRERRPAPPDPLLRAALPPTVPTRQAPQEEARQALGSWLHLTRQAYATLTHDPHNAEARAAYNFALARSLFFMQELNLKPWQKPFMVETPGGPLTVSTLPERRPGWHPENYRLVPADQFDVRGIYVNQRSIKPGVGAPLVAIGRTSNATAREDFLPQRTYYGVTALMRFSGNRAVLSLEDPLGRENVRFGQRTLPLAADFTVPLATMLAHADAGRMGIPRMLRPDKFAETAAITRLQPFDPNKRIVLVVHGLMDSPATWTPMINRLRLDPLVRENFQFWFFSYPSGYPYPYSAALLRRELQAALQRFPTRKPIILMGHSMGGCISALLAKESGPEEWRKIFGRTPEKTPLSPETRRLLEEALIFSPHPQIGRIIFLASPLRGAEMAQSFLGRLGSMIITSPQLLRTAGQEVLATMTRHRDDLKLRRMPNSIDTLAPASRLVRTFAEVPFRPGLPLHVIAGDRGQGGNQDKTPPIMTDGVVPFWSAALPEARSTKIVPSGHGVHQNPEAMEEVVRILHEEAAR